MTGHRPPALDPDCSGGAVGENLLSRERSSDGVAVGPCHGFSVAAAVAAQLVGARGGSVGAPVRGHGSGGS